MNDMVMFDPHSQMPVPAYLQGADNNVNAGLLAVAGAGGNRIGLKGNRFRLIVNGREEAVLDQLTLDVHVIGVFPHISRVFYANGYDPSSEAKEPPTCYSADGIAPAEDVHQKQCATCDLCPQNVKGSKLTDTGQKTKACSYMQRLVVMLPGDPDGRFFRLDVKAQGLFGEGIPAQNKYNLIEYGKAIANRSVDVSVLVTRISFDPNSSTPKLLFQPVRYVTNEEFEDVRAALARPDLSDMVKVNMKTVDLSGEVDGDDDAPVQQQAPVRQQPAQERLQQHPSQQQAPVRQQAPAQQAPAQQAPPPEQEKKPKQYKLGSTPLAEGLTVNDYLNEGWTAEQLVEAGYIEEIKPAAPKAPPPPAKRAVPPPPGAGTTPAAGTQTPVQRVPPPGQSRAPAPGTPVAAQAAVTEVASPTELKALLDELQS